MTSNVDPRGVKRGVCTEVPCYCLGYVYGVEGNLKCLRCDHAPGKHVNLGSVGVSSLLNPSTSTSTFSSYSSPLHLATPLSETSSRNSSSMQMHSGTGGAYATNYQPAGSSMAGEDRNAHVTTRHERPSPKRPQCQADGCTKPVFYDPELPEELATAFSYCSPHCRNVHLLPGNSATLVDELKKLKKELQGIVTAEKSAKPKQQTSASLSHSKSVTKETRQQSSNSIRVCIPKSADKPFGLILSQKPLHSDKADGFMITGVVRDSPAAKAMEINELMIFDVIETINTKRCSGILQSGKTPQECFDQEIASAKEVKLSVNHSFAINSLSSTLSYVRWRYPLSTHIIVMKYLPESKDDTFGLSFSDSYYQVSVKRVSADTPSRLSGVQYNDKIRMYALVSKGIKRAYQERKSVLLLLERH